MGSKLEKEYSNLLELSEKMTASQKSKRLNCDEILLEKDLWSLNLFSPENESEIKPKKMKYSDDVFHQYFVQIKSRMQSN